jgi:hypothetical protein
MFRADWNWWSNSRPPPVRAAAPEDLVGSNGGCSPGGTGPVGITLGITECDLVRTAGPTDQIVIGANDRGERTAVITYPQGERAGVYRFTAGLLTVIDRVPEPESPQRRPARRQRG